MLLVFKHPDGGQFGNVAVVDNSNLFLASLEAVDFLRGGEHMYRLSCLVIEPEPLFSLTPELVCSRSSNFKKPWPALA